MSRYIDTDRIDWRLIIPTNATTAEENMIYRAMKLVESQPKADVVEVVRCKDCEHASPNGEYGCKVYHFKQYEVHEMYADDYCSYGERREDGKIH